MVDAQNLASDVGRYNLLVNAGFETWQRGVGPFTASEAYTSDRWQMHFAGTDTMSCTRESNNVDSAGSWFSMNVAYTKGTGTGAYVQQVLSDGGTFGLQLRNRTLSVSVRVRANAANAVRLWLYSDGNSGGGSGAVQTYSPYHPGDNTWRTLTATLNVPAANFVNVAIFFEATVTAQLDNAWLGYGPVPLDFVPLHPADDMVRCHRYYETGQNNPGGMIIRTYAGSASQVFGQMIWFKARKSTTPTFTLVGTWGMVNCVTPAFDYGGADAVEIFSTSNAAGFSQFYTSSVNIYWVAEANS
jgi:hypothetical protein